MIWKAIVFVGRAIWVAVSIKARGEIGIARRPGGGPAVGFSATRFADRMEDVLHGMGLETQRVGPLVFIVTAPAGNAHATIAMPAMWMRDP